MVNLAHEGPDRRVTEALESLGLEYEPEETGCRLEFVLGLGRTQVVFIDSQTSTVGALELRKIWSCGYMGSAAVPEAVCAKLLDSNRQSPLGCWATFADGEEHFLVFEARVPAQLDAKSVKAVLVLVAEYADQAEQLLGGGGDQL